jgi:hypothetical protein
LPGFATTSSQSTLVELPLPSSATTVQPMWSPTPPESTMVTVAPSIATTHEPVLSILPDGAILSLGAGRLPPTARVDRSGVAPQRTRYRLISR